MSLAVVFSRALLGVDSPLVCVEAHLSSGLPSLSIVGLPETTIRESKDRVRSALLNTSFEFPPKRMIINLAPADLPKSGSRFDLPIALSILAASEQIPKSALSEYEFLGELALTGEIRGITGVLPAALACHHAGKKLILPKSNMAEAQLISGLRLYGATHISEVCAHLLRQQLLPEVLGNSDIAPATSLLEIADIQGQEYAKRALEITAAGGHSLLMIGPPGTGKSLLASRLPSILPSMTDQEALECAIIYSVHAAGFHAAKWKVRPFRTPHHSASAPALVGGSNPPRPGEISLAHHGVLFLDELPEFSRHVIESLREPLEKGCIHIVRAAHHCRFLTQFQLIAAMNPCPCGYYGDTEKTCRCTPQQIQQYHHRLSGPMLDRLDLSIEMKRIPTHQLLQTSSSLTSAVLRQRVSEARAIQIARQGVNNAQLTITQLTNLPLESAAKELLTTAVTQWHLSVRAYHRLLKVARTIADLDHAERIAEAHLSEALSFRTQNAIMP